MRDENGDTKGTTRNLGFSCEAESRIMNHKGDGPFKEEVPSTNRKKE